MTSRPTDNVYPSPPVGNVPATFLSAELFRRLRENPKAPNWASRTHFSDTFHSPIPLDTETLFGRHFDNESAGRRELTVTPVADLAVSTLAQLNKALLEVGKGVTDFPKTERLQQAVLDMTMKLDSVTEACSRLAHEAGVAQNALSSVGAGATSLLTNIEGAGQGANDLRKHLESLRTIVEAVDGNTQKVNSTVKEVVRFVQAELGSR